MLSLFRRMASATWKWGKKHTFHFIISIIIALMSTVLITQQTMIGIMKYNHAQDQETIYAFINNEDKVIRDLVKHSDDTTNARIDTINDSIDVDEKRRQLIARIRDAVQASTHQNMGVRDLNRIANAVIDYSYQYNFTIPQILAQIRVESNFSTKIISNKKAQGLMQIIPTTAVYIQYTMPNAPAKLNVFNIFHNVRAGCWYMSEQMEEFGDYEQALMAYNWGPHNLRAYNAGDIKDIPLETQGYAPAIFEKIEFFKTYGLE